MTKLSVNINKIATLRNSRGGNNPDLIRVALDVERFGAQGITVHPRPDERHIRKSDVYALHGVIRTEFNIEGFPDADFLKILRDIRPAQATLVPDSPDVLTSNAGWDTLRHQIFLKDIIAEIKSYGIRTSLFMAPDVNLIEAAKSTGCDRVELYTEAYAAGYFANREDAIRPYKAAAMKATELDLGINAGHDLSLQNLRFFAQSIPGLLEVSIGHALICDAIYLGLENTIQMYLRQLMID